MTDDMNTAKAVRPMPSFEELLTPAQVSRMTGHPETVLAVYRSRRNTGRSPEAGPAFHKIGREVFYARQDVEAFLDKKRG